LLIHEGQILSGQVTAQHVAAKRGCIWQKMGLDLGNKMACKSLSDHSRLIRHLCNTEVFSALAQDLYITDELRTKIAKLNAKGIQDVIQRTVRLFQEKTHDIVSRHEWTGEGEIMKELDLLTTRGGKELLESHRVREDKAIFPSLNDTFSELVLSGTKGEPVHLIQASSSRGQVKTQGQRNLASFGAR